jgi:YD repeat-containing protein
LELPLRLTSETAPNNATASVTYDGLGRVATSTAVTGAVTSFNYYPTAAPPYTQTTTNGKYVKTTLDGFGRAIVWFLPAVPETAPARRLARGTGVPAPY